MRRTVTACVETEVDVDLEDFSFEDLIDFIEGKGYTVIEGDYQGKGFKDFQELDKRVWELYQTFMLDEGDNNKMDRALRNFFADYYNKVTA
jgi:hypothetical protein